MARARLVTQKDFAQGQGVSPQYINKLVQQGKIRKIGSKIDARQAAAALKAWKRAGRVVQRSVGRAGAKPVRTGRGESDTFKLTKYRALREKAQAERAELELRAFTASLVPAAEVLEAERRKNANIRSSIRRLARSLAPQLHRAGSPAEIERLLLAEIDLALLELARDPLGNQEAAVPVPEQPEAQAPPPMPAVSPEELRA